MHTYINTYTHMHVYACIIYYIYICTHILQASLLGCAKRAFGWFTKQTRRGVLPAAEGRPGAHVGLRPGAVPLPPGPPPDSAAPHGDAGGVPRPQVFPCGWWTGPKGLLSAPRSNRASKIWQCLQISTLLVPHCCVTPVFTQQIGLWRRRMEVGYLHPILHLAKNIWKRVRWAFAWAKAPPFLSLKGNDQKNLLGRNPGGCFSSYPWKKCDAVLPPM